MSGQGKLSSVTMIQEFPRGEEAVGNITVPNYKMVHGKSILRCNSSPQETAGGQQSTTQLWDLTPQLVPAQASALPCIGEPSFIPFMIQSTGTMKISGK